MIRSKLLIAALILPFLMFSGTPVLLGQTTWYVDDDAPGDPGPGNPSVSDPLEDGSTNHPFDAIQEGIDAAGTGDTVMVRDGTYTDTGNRDLDFNGKAITVVSENGPDNCLIDAEASGRGFYFHSGESLTSRLEGFQIENGDAVFGGGIYCSDLSSPYIVNCTIRYNDADDGGGGIACDNSSPTITNCRIRNNSAGGLGWPAGGGIYCADQSNPTIENCTISDNSASSYSDSGQARGGGIYCAGQSHAIITDCTITYNSASNNALDGMGNGGGIYCNSSHPQITGSTISHNTVSSYDGIGGGGIYCYGSHPLIDDCTINDNTSDEQGGGIHLAYSHPEIRNSTISYNNAYHGGSAIRCNQSGPEIISCTLVGNSTNDSGTISCKGSGLALPDIRSCILANNDAEVGGAGIDCDNCSAEIRNSIISGNDSNGVGGGIRIFECSPVIKNSTIVDNISSNSGGGVYCDTGANPIIMNSILFFNSAVQGPEIWIGGTSPCNVTVSYSDIYGGLSVIHVESGHTLSWGIGMMDAIPRFIDYINADYHLSSDSPCIDSGDPTYLPDPDETDVDGNDRVQQYSIDMGADETSVLRDCNLNGTFDGLDISGGTSEDCDENYIPDECDIEDGILDDCNGNGIPDSCDLASGQSEDCNKNAIPDACEIEPVHLGEPGYSPGFQAGEGSPERCIPTPQDQDGDCLIDDCELGNSLVIEGGITTWYVDDDAPQDPGPGTPAISDPSENGSVYRPFDAIQEAIDVATNGDIILVADGTYTGTGNRVINCRGREITLKSTAGPASCIMDMEGAARGFFFTRGETRRTRVEGFTIMNGSANNGGGIYCRDLSSPTIENCIIKNNNGESGAGISCRIGCDPEIIDCIITNNTSTLYGGGIYCYSGSQATITGCTITYNTSVYGGAVYCDSSSPVIEDNLISNNHATNDCGGIYCYMDSNPSITDCTITNNTTVDDGGGIFCFKNSSPTISGCTVTGNTNGGIRCDEDSSPDITDCTISNNSSISAGGGIHCYDGSNPHISNCTITQNESPVWGSYGGGIYCSSSSPEIENCIISENESDGRGGGIYCYNSNPAIKNCMVTKNISGSTGGGIGLREFSSPEIQNVTISDNYADDEGGGLYACDSSNPVILNAIFWNNDAGTSGPEMWIGEVSGGACTVSISYSDVDGGQGAVFIEPGGSTLIWGSGMIDSDPLFVNPAGDDYHLSAGSPCIDTGDPAFVPGPGETDIDGEDRVENGIVDMGADEYYE